ncbi:replication protein P [Pseudoalteromonas phage vB_Pun_Y3]
MNNQIATTQQHHVKSPYESLVRLLSGEVLPALKAYYPASDFSWRGNLKQAANEYANQLIGLGVTAKEVKQALGEARIRSTSERHEPSPLEFKILCLQAKGMPTFESCMKEISEQRIVNYGRDKQWSEPLVYWLNQQIAAARADLSDSAWKKLAMRRYTELSDLYGKAELSPIPLRIEYNAPPTYLKYL